MALFIYHSEKHVGVCNTCSPRPLTTLR